LTILGDFAYHIQKRLHSKFTFRRGKVLLSTW